MEIVSRIGNTPTSLSKIFLKRHPKHRWLYQFSFDGKRFYNINDRNIIRIPPYEPLCKKLNSILAGATETFNGCYCKTTRSLAIIAA
jgi:hypothetical protein